MKQYLTSGRLYLKKLTAALISAGLLAGGFWLPARADEAGAAQDDAFRLVDIYCSQTAKDALGKGAASDAD